MVDFEKLLADRELAKSEGQIAADGKLESAEPTAGVMIHRPAPTGQTEIHCRILHETEKAILVEISNQGENSDEAVEHWFPLSTVGYIYRKTGYLKTNPDFTDIIHVANWLVSKNNLEV